MSSLRLSKANGQQGHSTLFRLLAIYGGLCIYLQLYGFFPVISPGNMATLHTGPTRGGLNKCNVNMKIRWTKGRRAADESFLVSGMNIVTGDAGPAFSPRNMEIVEIPPPIAEIGQGGRFFEKCLGLLVALEAKSVKFRVIRVVEFVRKKACPVFCQIRSMKGMTGGAQPFIDHAMLEG